MEDAGRRVSPAAPSHGAGLGRFLLSVLHAEPTWRFVHHVAKHRAGRLDLLAESSAGGRPSGRGRQWRCITRSAGHRRSRAGAKHSGARRIRGPIGQTKAQPARNTRWSAAHQGRSVAPRATPAALARTCVPGGTLSSRRRRTVLVALIDDRRGRCSLVPGHRQTGTRDRTENRGARRAVLLGPLDERAPCVVRSGRAPDDLSIPGEGARAPHPESRLDPGH